MKKMMFEEPELEVVHFNSKDIFTLTSGDLCNPDGVEDDENVDDCPGDGECDFLLDE